MALNASDFTREECEMSGPGLDLQSSSKPLPGYQEAPGRKTFYSKASGGDVIARVTAEGKPVAGEKVYFFLAADEGDNMGALFLPEFDDPGYLRFFCARQSNGPGPNRADFGRFKAVVTDKDGQASFNFIRDNLINYGGLEKALTGRGSVRYNIVAYVFEEPLEKTRQAGTAPIIKCYAAAPVEITSLAATVDERLR